MTSEERVQVAELISFQKEWRDETRRWQAGVEQRLADLETRNAMHDGRRAEREAQAAVRMRHRDKIIGGLMALGGAAITLLGQLIVSGKLG